MSHDNIKVVFCTNESEVEIAVIEWVITRGYKRLYTFRAGQDASHSYEDGGNWNGCENTPYGAKIVVVFGD